MKRIVFAFVFCLSVLSASAAMAQFTGPSASGQPTTVSAIGNARIGSYVTLTGTTSALSAAVLKGDIPFSAPPTITIGATQLQASAIAASSTEPGITGVYQWLRGATVIALPMKIGGGSGAPLRAIAILP